MHPLLIAAITIGVALVVALLLRPRSFFRALGRLICLFSISAGVWIAEQGPRIAIWQPKRPTAFPPRPRAKRLVTKEDELWVEKAHKARLSELETTRTAAKDWAAGLGAITGIFGIAALIQGPKEIARLTDEWKIAVAITVLVGILCALRGIFLAAVAAQGTPKSFRYDSDTYRAHYLHQLNLATAGLTISRLMVVIAVLAVTAAVGMTWFGEEKAAGRTDVWLVRTEGKPLCGTLTVEEDGSLKVTDAEGLGERVETADVSAFVPAGACPKDS